MGENYEIRIATVGNVDAGKSTTVGVIKAQEADDGKGTRRQGVFRHKHEIETGRTSDVGNQCIKYQNRLYSISDLAGHEGYLKTTLHGIISVPIDEVMLTVSAVDGIIGMSKEHFACAHVLGLNIFAAITKSEDDLAPPKIFKDNLDTLRELIRKVKRIPIMIQSPDDLQKYYDDITRTDDDGNKEVGVMDLALRKKYVPIFIISNVSLKGMNLLQTFIFNTHSSEDWTERRKSDRNVFVIDKPYNIKGVGLVVSGTIKHGNFKTGETYFLGPYTTIGKDGKLDTAFYPVTVRNIRDNYEVDVPSAQAGFSVCFNITTKDKIISRATIIKGMTITNKPSATLTFRAKIRILHHSTTIKKGYEPYLHVGGCKETIKIIDMDQEFIRMNQSTNAIFRFKHRYSFIDVGDKFIFREGRTRGNGEVLEIL